MATKNTITPEETLLSAHLHLGVVTARRRVTNGLAAGPIRTVCAWCDGPTAVLVDVPIDDRGLSHGVCQSCRSKLRSDSWTRVRGARV